MSTEAPRRLAGRLSAHFHSSEFGCKCGCGFGLWEGDVDAELVAGLQALRDAVGVPVMVSSGCRCAAHNGRTPGSSERSQHLLGKAADIWGPAVEELHRAALAVPEFAAGGVGYYPGRGFVHTDVRKDGPARWGG